MRKLAVLLLAVWGSTSHAWSAPPRELYGKTIRLTWTETREQRPQGTQDWQQVSGPTTHLLYISDAGRIFSRVSYSTKGGSARRPDVIASGQSQRNVTINGRSLVILAPKVRGGAMRLTAEFDATFSSCSAQVIEGKESPDVIVRDYSGIIKQYIEIRRYSVSGVTSGVTSGNSLGD